uniref:TITIN protein n=1 Tax=Dromaius novaehollandiae TaxID=8790 RepID=A0A8C4KLQ3_DRONO
MCKADLGAWQKVNAETVLATKYTVVDLEAGEHYKFRVSAVNGAGKGESCEVPATIQTVDRLSAPEIDIDANFKQTHIVRAGASIRLFIAFSGRPVPTAVWSKADANLSLRADIQTTDSFSTLTVEECNRNDAGKYVFTVENNSGSKSIAFTVKVLDTPGPPGPITFKDVTRGSITLMWDAPVLDGGSRIHHYIVEKREASRRSWQVVSSKCTRQIFKVTDLAEGMPYYYRVSAENEYGVGEPCELTEPVVATEEPAPPKRLDIVDTTKSSVVLAWLKPDHDGGSRVTGYLLEMKQKGSDYWIEAGQTKQLTFTVEGLMENNEYEFRVKAKNDAGYSEPREAFSSVIIKEPQIEPTADLSEISRQLITCKAGSTFTIDIPISGRPAPKVTWKLEEMRLKETERVAIKTTKDRTTLTVKDSMRGDSGKYYLTLENTAGIKTFTVTVVVIGRPGPVTGPIEISSVSSESSWQLVNSSVKRTQIKVTHLTKYQELKVTGLMEGSQYQFRVTAVNAAGNSEPSEASQYMLCKEPSCNISLAWSKPTYDGGADILGYVLEMKEEGTEQWYRPHTTATLRNAEFTVTGLKTTQKYQFRVAATNVNGMSEFSESSAEIEPVERIAAYIKVRVIGIPNPPEGPLEYDDIQARSVRVSWRPPTDDGGADILGYIVERREVPKTAWYTVDSRVKGTSLVVKGLKENVEYHFRVSAENHFGISKPLKSEEPAIPKTPLSKSSF